MGNTILLVESGEDFREYLSSYFSQRDFTVLCCTDFAAAERAISRQKFDVVIVDFFAGAQDGGPFCTHLAEAHSGGLIITSDQQSSEIECRIRSSSPAFYFVKPYSMDNLYAVVLKICESLSKKQLNIHQKAALPHHA